MWRKWHAGAGILSPEKHKANEHVHWNHGIFCNFERCCLCVHRIFCVIVMPSLQTPILNSVNKPLLVLFSLQCARYCKRISCCTGVWKECDCKLSIWKLRCHARNEAVHSLGTCTNQRTEGVKLLHKEGFLQWRGRNSYRRRTPCCSDRWLVSSLRAHRSGVVVVVLGKIFSAGDSCQHW